MFRPLALLVLIVSLLTSMPWGGPTPVAAQDATPAANDTETVALRFVEVLNQVFAGGNVDLLDAIVSPDVVDHTPAPTCTGGEAPPIKPA